MIDIIQNSVFAKIFYISREYKIFLSKIISFNNPQPPEWGLEPAIARKSPLGDLGVIMQTNF